MPWTKGSKRHFLDVILLLESIHLFWRLRGLQLTTKAHNAPMKALFSLACRDEDIDLSASIWAKVLPTLTLVYSTLLSFCLKSLQCLHVQNTREECARSGRERGRWNKVLNFEYSPFWGRFSSFPLSPQILLFSGSCTHSNKWKHEELSKSWIKSLYYLVTQIVIQSIWSVRLWQNKTQNFHVQIFNKLGNDGNTVLCFKRTSKKQCYPQAQTLTLKGRANFITWSIYFNLIFEQKKKKEWEFKHTQQFYKEQLFFFWLCILYLLISATISCDI